MYKIVRKEKLSDKIYLMDVEAPRVAHSCLPGQFIIVKIAIFICAINALKIFIQNFLKITKLT